MKSVILLFLVSLSIPGLVFGAEGVAMEKQHTLNQRQESIVAISALTANGNIEKLKPTLNEALDHGLTVNEVNEVIVHAYAYAGFPRSFNGMLAFMSVMDERQSKGIKDEMGKEGSPVPAGLDRDSYGAKVRAQLSGLDEVPPPAKWQEFSPVIDKFLKEHLFADLFARDILSFQDRELATVAILASMTGVDGPFRYHLGAAMNMGLSDSQMQEFVTIIKTKVGSKEAETAHKLLAEVLASRASK